MKKWLLTFGIFVACGATGYFLLARLGFLVPLSELTSVLCIGSCKSQQPVHPLISDRQLLNSERSLRQFLGKNTGSKKVSILIEKSKHRLTVFYDLQTVKSYPVVLGRSPIGNKLSEGDMKTPEGIYHVRGLHPHRDWSKFMWLDYPTPQSWREHFQAKLTGKINFFLPIGGQVGIHGVPNGKDALVEQKTNWTWGCISLKNQDVNEIYEFVGIGTLIEIVP